LLDLYSEGKKSIMLGMVELFTFVKMLEEDCNALMGGILIEYGAVTKNQVNLSFSMGWSKKKEASRPESHPTSFHSAKET
jgi:hypothetical protein